ncbi:uncharacterized protein LOC110828315 isoform X2 [Zootermopsis nevadensis]|uniref:uncharacterized protein LOC110828315 isoform X2 n=1 Tax=Zootermopsis nevadensis TaxID=136037 RepID=UPI000B8EE8A0|nr:uncharacterized protein LOC110828315 isoform X2 [Zootermopsis nevadensis]XP_021916624.1 uncharacterized protein LOC110828315 isoform X2 [Zootermopsis nevadensis]
MGVTSFPRYEPSSVEIGRLSPLNSCRNWSRCSRRRIILTYFCARKWHFGSTCQKHEFRRAKWRKQARLQLLQDAWRMRCLGLGTPPLLLGRASHPGLPQQDPDSASASLKMSAACSDGFRMIHGLQLCDKQLPTAAQFGPPVSGKMCSCTVAGIGSLPPDMVTAATVGTRSASPASPANSSPNSPGGRCDSTPGASVPEDLRDASRSEQGTSTDSSVDKDCKSSTDT